MCEHGVMKQLRKLQTYLKTGGIHFEPIRGLIDTSKIHSHEKNTHSYDQKALLGSSPHH